jgi:hypothetical protein
MHSDASGGELIRKVLKDDCSNYRFALLRKRSG